MGGMQERIRRDGHRFAHIDPLGPAPTLPLAWRDEPLAALWCGPIGAEVMHVEADEPRAWLIEEFERGERSAGLEAAALRALHDRLATVEAFEAFLHGRFVGAKRFSLEGAEALVPLIDGLVDELAAADVREVVVGATHRGRLNLLANVFGLARGAVLALIKGEHDLGDVPYHLGATTKVGDVAMTMLANPSHLEAIGPVVLGHVRARQEQHGSTRAVVGVVLHGDSAFTGQGIVAESLNLATTDGYGTGGTVHIVIDNQIGFTTDARAARSTARATDLARGFGVPILHVNGDEPEAVVRVARLAARWRQRHHADVVIALGCYRRRGHNEADEPRFTQPRAYAIIDQHPSVRARLAARLDATGVLAAGAATARVDAELAGWRATVAEPVAAVVPEAAPAVVAPPSPSAARLHALAIGAATLPPTLAAHAKVRATLAERARRSEVGAPIDWSTAETLAFAVLLDQGVHVRLSGQDSRRGTFAQRHAVVLDAVTGAAHVPLTALGGPGRFTVWDSPLSEAAILGFEYGYSVAAPAALTVWEAQYGDFANGAQVVIDEFIAAGAAKWGVRSNLVLLLPHGLEGQGPDHSYAHTARFLALAVADNLQICQPTTAAQLFHLLCGQAQARRPLIVLTPKAALRSPDWASPPTELAHGAWQEVLGDDRDATRVVLCAGRLHRELVQARAERGRADIALVRLEQLHPLGGAVTTALARYPIDAPVVWAQEEPRNLGAWPTFADRLPPLLAGRPLRCVARPASPSPSPGSTARYRAEQATLIDEALG
jgi:2-oxoglutarate dehydrogenase E1 component